MDDTPARAAEPSEGQSFLVVAAAYVVFWVAALPVSIDLRLLLGRLPWLPAWVSIPVALVVGVLFGYWAIGVFIELRGIRERYAFAPANNPAGEPIGCLDAATPFLVLTGMGMMLVQARLSNGLPPLAAPPGLLWTLYVMPFAAIAVMAMAEWWTAARSSLAQAAMVGDVKTVRDRLEQGVNVDAPDRFAGWTPLAWAIRGRHVPVVRLLLERGADPNRPDPYGRTPLLTAISQPDLVESLLAHGADPNQPSKDWFWGRVTETTPLIEAVPFSGIVQMLLNAGADPNERSSNGRTALMTAAAKPTVYYHHGDALPVESIRMLAAHGVHLHARDQDGKTALMLAEEASRDQIVEALREAGATE